jgi:hypothetical protein
MIRKAMLFNCLAGLPAMIANPTERAAWSKMRAMAVIPDFDLL